MPIYEFTCYDCDTEVEELRKLGDDRPPKCPNCGIEMSREFSLISAVVFKGRDGSVRASKQLGERSRKQGEKFFRRSPESQNLVNKTLKEKENQNGN